MYVRMHACMFVRLSVCIEVSVCVCVCIYACLYVCIYTIHMWTFVHVHNPLSTLQRPKVVPLALSPKAEKHNKKSLKYIMITINNNDDTEKHTS